MSIWLLIDKVVGRVTRYCKKRVRQADAFVFPAGQLERPMNSRRKPYSVVRGTYHFERECRRSSDDGRIHVVYPGTFDPRQGGALAAAVALFLDGRYRIHTIGFGNQGESKSPLDLIDEVATKTQCRIRYDGLLAGEEYAEVLGG